MISCKSCDGEIRIYAQATIEWGYESSAFEHLEFVAECPHCRVEGKPISPKDLGLDYHYDNRIDITALVNK